MAFIYLNDLTQSSNQARTVITPDGYQFYFAIRYQQLQTCWFFDIVYGDVIARYNQMLSGMQEITSSLKNILPFGIYCFTKDGYDPYDVSDFQTQQAQLYVGSRADIDEITTTTNLLALSL